MIERLIAWITGLFEPACTHPHAEARFRWMGEWQEFYWECPKCGEIDE